MSVITKKIGRLEYLTAEKITVPHCFTTRFGGVSEGIFSSFNLGSNRGDEPEKVREILEEKKRTAAGVTAPACGLVLVEMGRNAKASAVSW